MLLEFDKFAMKGNQFLHQLENNLATNNRAHAARILRSTFRVLRNHLTFEESLQLISQLPMAIKSVYVDGWKASQRRKIKTIDDFLVEILQEEGDLALIDFQSSEDILDSVRAVVDTLRLYVSSEEIDQALGTLPKRIQTVFAND